MSGELLLPNKYKPIGWFLLIPSTIMGIILSLTGFDKFQIKTKVLAIFNEELFEKIKFASIIEANLTNTIVGIVFIVGAMFVGFSKEKKEDEFIAKLRLSSLLWAVWVNYGLLTIATLFVYGTAYFNVMVYNMFTVLIIFIVRFSYILYKNNKIDLDEK